MTAMRAGWVRITALGAALILLTSVPFASRGRAGPVRFGLTALVTFGVQQALVAAALAMRPAGEPDDLDAVDALTLSRGLGAAVVAGAVVSGARGRDTYAAKLAWPIALCGSTLTDWIDGPLARRRRRGPTSLGRILDLELDSWLTFATTLAAVRLGGLHPVCLATPSLRYVALAAPVSYADVHAVGKSKRARNLGITQMTLALASFAPFSGSWTNALARVGSLALVPIHVVALLAAMRAKVAR